MSIRDILKPNFIQMCLIVVVVFGLFVDSSKAQSDAAIIWYTALKLAGMLAVTFLPFVAKYEFLSPEVREKQLRSGALKTLFLVIVGLVIFGIFIFHNFYRK